MMQAAPAGDQPMQWTTTTPTADGLYWLALPGQPPEVVQRQAGVTWFLGTGDMNVPVPPGSRWCGPLAPPPDDPPPRRTGPARPPAVRT